MRIAIIAAGIAFVAGAAAWPVSSKAPQSPAAIAHVEPKVTRSSAFEIGAEHVYGVSLKQVASGAADLTVELNGRWAVAYAGEDERGLVFRAQLRDAKPSVRRGELDASGAFTAALARAYYFTTTRDGRLIAMHFAPDTEELTKGALSTLASLFQVSRKRSAAWDTVESDSLGDFEVRYTRKAGALRRDRVRYMNAEIDAKVVGTGTDIAMRDDGWPAKIAGSETTQIGVEQIAVTIATSFTIDHESSARTHAGWHDGLELAPVVATTNASSLQADQQLVDGASLADLLAALAKVGDDSHARGYQFLRIAALLRLDADAVAAAERAVLAGDDSAPVLIAALGEAGTPDAQRALERVMASTLGEEPRTHAAISLGLTETPTRSTLDALANAARAGGDLGASATLAQGNAALRMRDDDAAAATRVIEDLLARFARASTDDERILVVRALGNTGDERIVPAIEQALASRAVALRAASVEALRLVPGADTIIVARLADTSPIVRAAAVFAAGQRDIAVYASAFDGAVRRDSDADVRRAIVELAGARITEHAALRGIVAHAAEHDADADLRAFAKQLLEQAREPV